MTDLTLLRELAQAARQQNEGWFSFEQLPAYAPGLSTSELRHIAACSPDVILSLLDALDAANATLWAKQQHIDALEGRIEDNEQEITDLHLALTDAIEWGDEGWGYASDYFRDKWDYQGQRDKIVAIIDKYKTHDN